MQKKLFTIAFAGIKIQVDILLLILILLLTAGIYIPVFQNSFTNWDDGLYVIHNPYLKNFSIQNLKNIFTIYYAGNYHPLTLISMAGDYKMGGPQPFHFQLTNLILHLCNIVFVYIFAKSILPRNTSSNYQFNIIPFVTALLFGIHTFQVESVAWISERKNVLYAFFFLLSLITYIKYLKNQSYWTYTFSLILFVLSLLSKGMAIPLSICLIVIDYFAGRNILSKKVLLEKVPFIILSLVFGVVAILAQHSGEAISINENNAWLSRIAFACYGFVQYLIKLCYPFQLSAYYPYPIKSGGNLPLLFYASLLIVGALAFLAWRFFRKNKHVMFGALFFIANISIVIQLLPVGDAIMADRYTYIPSVGFFFIVGYFCNNLLQKPAGYKPVLITLLTLYCVVLGAKTYQRVGVWKDSLTLWNDALKHQPRNNDRGHQNRGNIYFDMGLYTEAFQDYNKLLKIDPKNSGGYVGMARIKQVMNDRQGALEDFNTALTLKETYEGYIDRAVLKIEMQDFDGGMYDLDKAYQINPFRTGVYVNKGFIYYQMRNYPEAIKYYNMALQIDSRNNNAYLGRGRAKQALQDLQGALNDFNFTLSLNKTYEGFLNRAVLKIALEDFQGALMDLDYASQFRPISIDVLLNKGIVFLNTGYHENAIMEFNKVLELDAKNYQAYLYRGMSKINLSDYTGAVTDLGISVQIHPNADAYYHRGIAMIKSGRKYDGCNDLKQAVLLGNIAAKDEIHRNCK